MFNWNPSSEKNELDRGMSQTKGDRFDTNLDDGEHESFASLCSWHQHPRSIPHTDFWLVLRPPDPAGIARKQMAQASKERYAREAAELQKQNSSFFSMVNGTDAKEDDDIMGARGLFEALRGVHASCACSDALMTSLPLPLTHTSSTRHKQTRRRAACASC